MTEPAYADIRLGDGRVALRPWRADDAPLMAAASVDPEIALFCMMPAGYTVELARDFIAGKRQGETVPLGRKNALRRQPDASADSRVDDPEGLIGCPGEDLHHLDLTL